MASTIDFPRLRHGLRAGLEAPALQGTDRRVEGTGTCTVQLLRGAQDSHHFGRHAHGSAASSSADARHLTVRAIAAHQRLQALHLGKGARHGRVCVPLQGGTRQRYGNVHARSHQLARLPGNGGRTGGRCQRQLGGASQQRQRQRKAAARPLRAPGKWLKYAIFFALLTVSMFSMGLAEKLAEVEPFKTTFLVGVTNRAWPYSLFVAVLLGISIFIERPFCKYLCPLGASLAMPSTFRWFGLKRKQDCNSCKACAVGCGAQAIDEDGRIDHRECLHCLDCMILYTDTKGCPPLARERKRREKDGLELTPIGKNGYFIPIYPARAEDQILPKARDGVDPRMPTNPTLPAHKQGAGLLQWLMLELRDHLWPWSAEGWRSQRALQIAGLSLAVAATLAWVLTAMGHLSSGAIIGWWFGWSVYEVLIRLSGRRYVKDGPWWRDNYRVSGVFDMISYVGFKNLMIGAALFLALKALGWLIA